MHPRIISRQGRTGQLQHLSSWDVHTRCGRCHMPAVCARHARKQLASRMHRLRARHFIGAICGHRVHALPSRHTPNGRRSAGLQSLPDHTRYVHATSGLEQKVHHLPPWRQLHISAVLWRQEGMVVVSIADHHGRRRDPLARWNRPSSNILVSHERSHQILQAAWARQ